MSYDDSRERLPPLGHNGGDASSFPSSGWITTAIDLPDDSTADGEISKRPECGLLNPPQLPVDPPRATIHPHGSGSGRRTSRSEPWHDEPR